MSSQRERPPKPKDVYRVADRHLGTWAESSGFRRGSGAGCWEGEREGLRVTLWLQCDKWGWTADGGGRFTLNFDLERGAEETPAGCLRRMNERYHHLVEPEDGDEYARLARAVAAKIPPDAEPLAELSPFEPANDPWMPYYDAPDVERWCADFLAPRLDRMLRALLLGGGRRLPRAIEALDMPGLAVEPAPKRPGALRSGSVVYLPRAHLPRLRALLASMDPGRSVLLRSGPLAMIWTAREGRRGSLSSVSEIGLTGILRCDWVLGTATLEALRSVMEGDPPEGPTELFERIGEVPASAAIAIAIV